MTAHASDSLRISGTGGENIKMSGSKIAWAAAKTVAVVIVLLWASFVTLYVWKTYEAARLGCNYAAHAARSSDEARGMISDLGSGCF
jgi:hypothetical protein